MVSYAEVKSYLSKREIPQLFESLMAGLMYHRPENHISYLQCCLEELKSSTGESRVQWNMFVNKKKRKSKETLPPLTPKKQDSVSWSSDSRQSTPLPPISARSRAMRTAHNTGGHCKNTYLLYHNPPTVMSPPDVPVIFALGGSGTRIDSLCEEVVASIRGVVHVSANSMLKTRMVIEGFYRVTSIPACAVVDSVLQAMSMVRSAKALLVAGFPRNRGDVEEYRSRRVRVDGAILVDFEEEALRRFLLSEVESGLIKTSEVEYELDRYKQDIISVAEYYDEKEILTVVMGDQGHSEVVSDMVAAVDRIIENRADSSMDDDLPDDKSPPPCIVNGICETVEKRPLSRAGPGAITAAMEKTEATEPITSSRQDKGIDVEDGEPKDGGAVNGISDHEDGQTQEPIQLEDSLQNGIDASQDDVADETPRSEANKEDDEVISQTEVDEVQAEKETSLESDKTETMTDNQKEERSTVDDNLDETSQAESEPVEDLTESTEDNQESKLQDEESGAADGADTGSSDTVQENSDAARGVDIAENVSALEKTPLHLPEPSEPSTTSVTPESTDTSLLFPRNKERSVKSVPLIFTLDHIEIPQELQEALASQCKVSVIRFEEVIKAHFYPTDLNDSLLLLRNSMLWEQSADTKGFLIHNFLWELLKPEGVDDFAGLGDILFITPKDYKDEGSTAIGIGDDIIYVYFKDKIRMLSSLDDRSEEIINIVKNETSADREVVASGNEEVTAQNETGVPGTDALVENVDVVDGTVNELSKTEESLTQSEEDSLKSDDTESTRQEQNTSSETAPEEPKDDDVKITGDMTVNEVSDDAHHISPAAEENEENSKNDVSQKSVDESSGEGENEPHTDVSQQEEASNEEAPANSVKMKPSLIRQATFSATDIEDEEPHENENALEPKLSEEDEATKSLEAEQASEGSAKSIADGDQLNDELTEELSDEPQSSQKDDIEAEEVKESSTTEERAEDAEDGQADIITAEANEETAPDAEVNNQSDEDSTAVGTDSILTAEDPHEQLNDNEEQKSEENETGNAPEETQKQPSETEDPKSEKSETDNILEETFEHVSEAEELKSEAGEQKSETGEPKSEAEEPESETEKPKSEAEETKSETDNTTDEIQEQKSEAEDPKTETEELKSETEEPASQKSDTDILPEETVGQLNETETEEPKSEKSGETVSDAEVEPDSTNQEDNEPENQLENSEQEVQKNTDEPVADSQTTTEPGAEIDTPESLPPLLDSETGQTASKTDDRAKGTPSPDDGYEENDDSENSECKFDSDHSDNDGAHDGTNGDVSCPTIVTQRQSISSESSQDNCTKNIQVEAEVHALAGSVIRDPQTTTSPSTDTEPETVIRNVLSDGLESTADDGDKTDNDLADKSELQGSSLESTDDTNVNETELPMDEKSEDPSTEVTIAPNDVAPESQRNELKVEDISAESGQHDSLTSEEMCSIAQLVQLSSSSEVGHPEPSGNGSVATDDQTDQKTDITGNETTNDGNEQEFQKMSDTIIADESILVTTDPIKSPSRSRGSAYSNKSLDRNGEHHSNDPDDEDQQERSSSSSRGEL